MIDLASAQAMGLNVTKAHNNNFGHYFSPGYKPQPYAGLVHGPITLKFSNQVTLSVPYIKIVESERPLIILGADLLAGGRTSGGWNFVSMPITTDHLGRVTGHIEFINRGQIERVPLVCCPKLVTRDKEDTHIEPTPTSATSQVTASNSSDHSLSTQFAGLLEMMQQWE